ncbi:hypothetical protein [Arvimicrobium flavum]|uniref:hypothetical protein n=1 Tax=Arvimicrobium flavum TaxID=3393320 RepID=UPI00237B8FF3|nr:hypothetical protein [Mesorhizobium shangrilense]
MRASIFAIAILSGVLPAAASGGLDCGAKDKKVEFNLHAGVSRGMGSAIFAFESTVKINDQSIAEDLRKTGFSREDVAQYWLDGKDLRLNLYREREGDKPHGYVELVIYTQSEGDEIGYGGTYELTVYDGVGDNAEPKEATFKGEVGCSVE